MLENIKIIYCDDYQKIKEAFITLFDSQKIIKEEEYLNNYLRKVHKNGITIIAYENDCPVGLISFYANDPTKEKAYITQIVVHNEKAGRGLGTLLLKKCQEFCFRNSFNYLHLEVRVSNKRAIKLYEQFGFVEYSGTNDGSFYMKKKII